MRQKRTKFVVGGLLAIILPALVYFAAVGAANLLHSFHPEREVVEVVATFTPTEEVGLISTPVMEATEEIVGPPRTEEPSVEPTAEPTMEPTVEPTVAPTQVPTQMPTQEPAVQVTWQVVSDESGQPINQAMVWLAFNKDEPAQIFWSNEKGDINITFDEVPNLGQNGLGYAVFEDRSNPNLLKTELWFQLDETSRKLVLVDAEGRALDGSVRLSTFDGAGGQPESWSASQVWGGCADQECATEIALTSGYFKPNDLVVCQTAVLDAPQGSFQRYRMANGLSVVESTVEHPNLVDPQWFDEEAGIPGWDCGNEKERIFVVDGCGNIATAVKPRE